MRTPSTTRSSPVWRTVSVGGIRPMEPTETVLPRPEPTAPRSPKASGVPNWYWARRVMALPASTFSATACSMKPSGAMMDTLPARTSASSTTPRTPPKWSTWLCV